MKKGVFERLLGLLPATGAVVFVLQFCSPAIAVVAPDGQIIPLTAAKKTPLVSPNLAKAISASPARGKIKIWVYFTDKEVFTHGDYRKAVSDRIGQFPAKTIARKSKVKKQPVDFTDLPVSAEYLRQVASTGARLVHPLRWFNCASFYADAGQIQQISNLPFVSSLDIVKRYKVQPEPVEFLEPKDGHPLPQTAAANALNYGGAFNQLNQVNVPPVHNLGHDGSSMIIGMFDTGFRKDHPAFADILADGRLLAEYDFVHEDSNTQDEVPPDPSGQHGHGTSTWSVVGGQIPDTVFGAAYNASFVLAKTEWVPSESLWEEDNWAAAAEWLDSLGGDIISSSVAYLGFDDGFSYAYSDLNGDVAITTNAADMAAANGILVCNSAGNAGSGAGSIHAPADADSIIAAGAVNSTGAIASFSSRGPTFDGRIKPELVARGVSTYLAVASTLGFGSGSGTSFSCPLLAGCAGLLWSARPTLTNMQIRQAMIGSADKVDTPDNTYGYGLPDMLKALRYSFVPGDLNGNETVTLGDVIFLVNHVLKSGYPEPVPLTAGDVNCDSSVALADIIYLVNFLFKQGPAPCSP